MNSLSPPTSRGQAIALWALATLVILAAIWTGLCMRRQAYDLLVPLHFRADIDRGWGWGTYTFENMHDRGRSFLDTYDDMGIQDRRAEVYIDYAPARLAVMTAWAAWNHRTWPYGHRTEDWAFQSFFVLFNTAMEFAAAAGVFFLTRRVVRLAELRSRPIYPGTGLLPALAAGLVLWFNPAMVISSHGWPCGDGWVVAPFLWTAYFSHRRQGFIAGLVLGLGVLFKGQLFFVSAIFLLWPLFQLRWRQPLWFIAGFFSIFGLLTAGWTLTRIDAGHVRHIAWPAVACVIGVAIIAIVLLLFRRHERGRPLRYLQTRPMLLAALGLMGAIAFSSMWLFHTNYPWFDASYCFGTDHWEVMTMGVTSNLPGILQAHYGWADPKEIVFTYHTHDVSLRLFLFLIFATLLFLTAIGLAWQDARKSRRFLIAIVTPWLLFFAFPAQIHERYLLFGAATAAICCGYSAGMALLGIFMSLITAMMTLHVMLYHGQKPLMDSVLTDHFPWLFPKDNQFAYALLRFIEGTHPDIGWALLLLTGVFFYFTMIPGRRPIAPLVEIETEIVDPPEATHIDAGPRPERIAKRTNPFSDKAPPFDDGPIPVE